MTTARPDLLPISPADRGRLMLDAVDASEAIAQGEWSISDALALSPPDELVAGMFLYAQYLEATLTVKLGANPAQIRAAARGTARIASGQTADG